MKSCRSPRGVGQSIARVGMYSRSLPVRMSPLTSLRDERVGPARLSRVEHRHDRLDPLDDRDVVAARQVDAVARIEVRARQRRIVRVARDVDVAPVRRRLVGRAVHDRLRHAVRVQPCDEQPVLERAPYLEREAPVVALVGVLQQDRVAEGGDLAREERPAADAGDARAPARSSGSGT